MSGVCSGSDTFGMSPSLGVSRIAGPCRGLFAILGGSADIGAVRSSGLGHDFVGPIPGAAGITVLCWSNCLHRVKLAESRARLTPFCPAGPTG